MDKPGDLNPEVTTPKPVCKSFILIHCVYQLQISYTDS